MTDTTLTARQRQILELIDQHSRTHGYPPSVREIGEAVGLTSPSTVHSHLGTLVPLVGEVAAGTDVLAAQNITESLPLPAEFTGDGELFMLQVRGDSMIGAGIFAGDYVVVRRQATADDGDLVVAGIPGEGDEEATVKHFRRDGAEVVLTPANPDHPDLRHPADEVKVFGRVVTVLRRL